MEPFFDPDDLAVAGATLVVVMGSLFTAACVPKLFVGSNRSSNRLKIPWRFSLGAIGGLTALTASVFALFRDFPCTALVLAGWTLILWVSLARFDELRRVLADRSKREFENTIATHRTQPSDGPKGSGP